MTATAITREMTWKSSQVDKGIRMISRFIQTDIYMPQVSGTIIRVSVCVMPLPSHDSHNVLFFEQITALTLDLVKSRLVAPMILVTKDLTPLRAIS